MQRFGNRLANRPLDRIYLGLMCSLLSCVRVVSGGVEVVVRCRVAGLLIGLMNVVFVNDVVVGGWRWGHRKCWARLRCQGERRVCPCPAGASGC